MERLNLTANIIDNSIGQKIWPYMTDEEDEFSIEVIKSEVQREPDKIKKE